MKNMQMCQQLELIFKNSLNKIINYYFVLISLSVLQQIQQVHATQSAGSLKVVYAVNAGGREHTDSNGIHYDADPLHNKIGTASDYGNNLLIIGRVSEQDETLFRTERYHTATFGYDVPIDGDGDYALIMKFCEVYFNEPNKKVFDVVLNKEHTIVPQLDIFHRVGHGAAHEEYAYFGIINGKLYFKDEVSEVRNGFIRLDFIKGNRDNPKINAFALLKGDIDHIPRLTPLTDSQIADESMGMFDEPILPVHPHKQHMPGIAGEFEFDNEDANSEDDDEVDVSEKTAKLIDDDDAIFYQRKVSGPRYPNPYVIDDSSVLLPLFIAVGAFIPMLYCLCKL